MPTQREEDEAKIRQQVDKIVEGIRAKDLEGLRRLYATDVVSFDVDPPLQHVGIEAKLKNWVRAFTFFEDVDYEVRDLTVTVGDDVAFGHAFGRLSGTLKDGTATSGMSGSVQELRLWPWCPEGLMGWLSNRLPAACGLAYERRAGLSVSLPRAWLKRHPMGLNVKLRPFRPSSCAAARRWPRRRG